MGVTALRDDLYQTMELMESAQRYSETIIYYEERIQNILTMMAGEIIKLGLSMVWFCAPLGRPTNYFIAACGVSYERPTSLLLRHFRGRGEISWYALYFELWRRSKSLIAKLGSWSLDSYLWANLIAWLRLSSVLFPWFLVICSWSCPLSVHV